MGVESLRIGIADLSHETNTFCPGRTGLDEFEIKRDDEVREFEATETELGAAFKIAATWGAQVVPLMTAGASPSGPIAAEAYASLKAELLKRIGDAGSLDALYLGLHGAGVAVGVDDLEGDLAAAVRTTVGPSVRLVSVLDLHGNVTQPMADALDFAVPYREYPHVDGFQRGEEVMAVLGRLLKGSVAPVAHVEHLPMLLGPTPTTSGPAAEVNALCRSLERDGVIACTFFHGFPYVDSPLCGAHIVVWADGDPELARSTAVAVARRVWDRREEFRIVPTTAEEAVARAARSDAGLVVINEAGDNPGGGAPGDGTHLLRAMLDAGLTDSAFGFIFDPEVVAAASEAGPRAEIDVSLGGKHDQLHGTPLHAHAVVRSVTDGRFAVGWVPGTVLDRGPMARLTIGGIDVLVSSRADQVFGPEPFALHGIDVTQCRVVGLKGSSHFRAGFESLAAEMIRADTPGLTTTDVGVFDRVRTGRRVWPIDPEAEYLPTERGILRTAAKA